MNRKTRSILLAVLLVLLLAGCAAGPNGPSLEIKPNDDNTITITANRAGISGGGGADITVSEGQELVVDSTLSKGEITVRFFRDNGPDDPDASVDDILHANEEPALTVTVTEAGTTSYPVAPGSYTIMVSVQKTSNGIITIGTK